MTKPKPKPWCNDNGVLNLHHDNDVREVRSQPSITWHKSANQKIGIRTVSFILVSFIYSRLSLYEGKIMIPSYIQGSK